VVKSARILAVNQYCTTTDKVLSDGQIAKFQHQ